MRLAGMVGTFVLFLELGTWIVLLLSVLVPATTSSSKLTGHAYMNTAIAIRFPDKQRHAPPAVPAVAPTSVPTLEPV